MVFKVAIHVPGVGSKPGPVTVPEPERFMTAEPVMPWLIKERVSENPPTDHNAPAGSAPAGFTAIDGVNVATVKFGTEEKSPAV
jgi:hypothetical protein